MLVGTADPADFSKDAPTIERFSSEATSLLGVTFVHALFEVESTSMCEVLPPALHPTLPPVAGITAYHVPDSEWGSFRIAQLRIECRSGLRPRGLLVLAVVDRAEAGQALAARFGFRTRVGTIDLMRGYDRSSLRVQVEERCLLDAHFIGPERIGENDTQFVSSIHPAQTPRGFRLVQVDIRHTVARAERSRLRLGSFDAEGWGEARLVPTLPLPGVIGLADVRIDPTRFVCRPEVMAFEGSESVD